MEVHHHPHEAKGFKQYFLEFLMIFLAVALGFFAENMREHLTENKRAKELASSLYVDLRSDTAALNRIVRFRKLKEAKLDTLFLLLDRKPKTINAALFFNLIIPIFSTDPFSETESTGTIAQLKNAGYLRYYAHTDIPQALAGYESSVNSLLGMDQIEYQEIFGKAINFLKEKIDPALFRAGYSSMGVQADIDITPTDPTAFRLLYGDCAVIGILNRNIYTHYIVRAEGKATALMEIIKKLYHIK